MPDLFDQIRRSVAHISAPTTPAVAPIIVLEAIAAGGALAGLGWHFRRGFGTLPEDPFTKAAKSLGTIFYDPRAGREAPTVGTAEVPPPQMPPMWTADP